MTNTLSFRKRLQKGDTLIGALLQMPLPEVAETFVQAGYDWLFVDLEHSPMDARNALDVLAAVDSRIPCVVRVPFTTTVRWTELKGSAQVVLNVVKKPGAVPWIIHTHVL